MQHLSTIQIVSISIIPILFAISVHEWAHGYIANRLGDNTAAMLGRLSINPIKHIDIIGTIVVPIALLLLGGFIFGWAKPVPVNTRHFKRPMHSMAIVAVAGPLSNLVMAFGWALLALFVRTFLANIGGIEFVFYMCVIGIQINVALMILNLLPIPPLDGSKVLAPLLPRQFLMPYLQLEKYGFFILLILIYFGWLSAILSAPVHNLVKFFLSFAI